VGCVSFPLLGLMFVALVFTLVVLVVCFFLVRSLPHLTFFPYTTLFRSKVQCGIMSLTRKSLWAATVGYWMCCWTQYPTVAAHKEDRKSTRLNSSHQIISYAVFRLNKKTDAAANETRDDPAAPIPEHNTL